MNSTYLDKYTIVQTFKETIFQKVFIGTDNKNGQAVVINNIYIDGINPIWNSIEETYKLIFKNILHFERLEDKVVFVTKVEEGLSLKGYLKDFSPSFTERVHLIHQYLNGIKRYDILPNNIKSVLVNESQIIISEGNISFDELLIFGENSFEATSFKLVLDNIISVFKKLTSLKSINYEEVPLYIKVMGFLDDLQKNSSSYINISDISRDLLKLNINNLSLVRPEENILNGSKNPTSYNTNNLVGRKVGSIKEDSIRIAGANKSRIFTAAISTAGVATVALAGFFAFKSIFPLDKDTALDANLASTEIVSTNNIDSNKDTENNVLDGTSAENLNKEPVGPNDNISYISEHIEQDFTTSKYGDFSFKISGNEGTSHKISINQGSIKPNSQLLMWVKSNTDDKFNISVEGYSSNTLSFQESISHKPLALNNWELVQITFNNSVNDYVDINFDGIDGTVWVDKISIAIFK